MDEVTGSDGGEARYTLPLLALGAALGIGLAAVSLLGTDPSRVAALPDDAVARVGDTLLRRTDYERALAALASDRREPLRPEDARRVLDRMIEEELLVQRGIELDLVRRDRFTRGALVNAVIALVAGQSSAAEPTQDELRAFYEEYADYFATPGRLHLRQVFVRVASNTDDDAGRERAEAAAQQLRAGVAIAAVRESLGDPEAVPVPDTPLPPIKLREYLGPTPVRTALTLAAGETSDPVRSTLGYHVLHLVRREPAATPPFESIESQVRAELQRRNGDQALRDYLDELRARADVVVAAAPDAAP